jgi:hypothetical protein
MKFSFILFWGLFLNLVTHGQSDEKYLFPLNTYVNNSESKLPEGSLSILTIKINNIVAKSGIGGNNFSNPRFVLYTKFVTTKKNFISGISSGVSISAELYLHIGDAFGKTIFASYIIPAKGYGFNLESAMSDAIKNIDTDQPKIQEFVADGLFKINNYFTNQCPLIIAKSKALASEQKYDEAIFNLYTVPESSNICYIEAAGLVKDIYKLKIEEESATYLRKAKLIWSSSQQSSSIREILVLLDKVNPIAKSFSEIDPFILEINKKVESNNTRDWLEKLEIRKQELEKDKIKLSLEKDQLEAIKQISIAYASGTHIYNNYTSNSYSSNYYSRLYDYLYW